MELFILGKNSDDTGSQLEKLTVTLLKSLGYSNVVTNDITSGGQEIDVRAEHAAPSLGGRSIAVRLICECKAHKTPIAMTEWLKFLGKVFVEEARRSSQVSGCFIALSGVNGNVSGSYDQLRLNRPDIELITGERLLELLQRTFDVAAIDTITQQVSDLSDRPVTRLDLCYYNQTILWLVQFADDTFTVMHAKGRDSSIKLVDEMMQLMENTIAGTYVDLEAEAAAKQRQALVEKISIGSLMLLDGQGTLDAVESCWAEDSTDNLKCSVLRSAFIDALGRLADQQIVRLEDRST